ncbi:hypothetical protein IKP94_00310 [Candidatus Saccharibacteria bacterium]|nr:hypothetical protein [Candidatus Saccharibacteria bacterium]
MAKKKNKEPSPHLYSIKLFISRETYQEVDGGQLWLAIGPVHGMKIPYTSIVVNYDEKRHRLTAFQNGNKICDRDAYYGSAFEIIQPQNRKKTRVTLLRYPHGTENVIPWICGYTNPETRTTNLKHFHQIRRIERAKLGANWCDHGTNHRGRYHRFSSINVNGETHLTAAYADPRMDKAEIAQVVSACRDTRYPVEFIKNILYAQAGFRGGDFATVI